MTVIPVSASAGMTLDDKYIGLVLAFSGSLAIGTSFIITKKVCALTPRLNAVLTTVPDSQGLNDASERSSYANASDNYVYLKNPIWWAGMAISAFFSSL